jgi:hypothetical protein
MSLEIVKCPYCGFVYKTDIQRIIADGHTTVVRALRQESAFIPVNSLIDLSCPHYGEVFEWPPE